MESIEEIRKAALKEATDLINWIAKTKPDLWNELVIEYCMEHRLNNP